MFAIIAQTHTCSMQAEGFRDGVKNLKLQFLFLHFSQRMCDALSRLPSVQTETNTRNISLFSKRVPNLFILNGNLRNSRTDGGRDLVQARKEIDECTLFY